MSDGMRDGIGCCCKGRMIGDDLPNGIYRHYKGKEYLVIGVAQHSENKSELIVYSDINGQLWVRPKEMFLESVEVDGCSVPRFQYTGKTHHRISHSDDFISGLFDERQDNA